MSPRVPQYQIVADYVAGQGYGCCLGKIRVLGSEGGGGGRRVGVKILGLSRRMKKNLMFFQLDRTTYQYITWTDQSTSFRFSSP